MQSTIKDEVSAVRQLIAEKVGAQKFQIWFENSTSLALSDGYVKIGTPNLFIANWIEGHFANEISQAAQAITGRECRLSFVIDHKLLSPGRAVQSGSTANLSAAGTGTDLSQKRTQSHKNVADEKFTRKLSFDMFVVGQSNELAYNAARTVAAETDSPFNPLFIHGGYGIGKTHLLQGICNAVRRSRPEANWLYLSAEDFANQFVLALKTRKLEAFRRRMRQTDLLVIDDIHFLASKPSTQGEFLYTFNTIDLAGKQVVMASDAHPKMIRELSEKLVNRFVSGMVVKIGVPDFNTRCKICRQYAGQLRKHIPKNVIDYIASNMKTSIRELQGALLKLIAFASLDNGKINLATAKKVLQEHLARTDPRVHISDIESATAVYFGITTANLHSSKKSKTIAMARHFSMYLARKHTSMSSTEIGRFMGNKNHATVLLACKKVDDQLKHNVELNWQPDNRTGFANKVVKARAILANLERIIAE